MMNSRRNRKSKSPTDSRKVALPVVTERVSNSRMGWRRFWVLVGVHILAAAHIWHYQSQGSTISPLEPSEGTYSLQTGVINAGLIFLCVLLLSTLLLGRFFCGWACHVVAYQDLARWIMLRAGIVPKPIKMRLAFLFPLFAAYWLYGKPIVNHWLAGTTPDISWHLTTEDFWRTFPGPIMTTATFAVCGFVIVYVMGAKGFCTYGCPYGFLFGIADRASPAKIRVNDDCTGTSVCTSSCSSNVDVATEVRLYGKVVDPGCMKCLDCVTSCPNDALSFGFRNQRQNHQENEDAPKTAQSGIYSFTVTQEIAIALLWTASFLAYFKLYVTVPLLLAIGMSVVATYIIFDASKMVLSLVNKRTAPNKIESRRWTSKDTAFLAVAVLVASFTVHSGIIRWYTYQGTSAFERAAAALEPNANRPATTDANRRQDAISLAQSARASLKRVEEWGLFHTQGLGRMIGRTYQWEERDEQAIPYLKRDIEHGTVNPMTPFYLGQSLQKVGRTTEASAAFRRVLERKSVNEQMFLTIGKSMAANQDLKAALDVFSQGHQRYPANAELAMENCKILARETVLGKPDLNKALQIAETASTNLDHRHADLLAMLAYLYAETGRLDDAVAMAQRSLDLAVEKGETQIAKDMEQMVAYYRSLREQR
ncbi:MAG: 4Fe-4S binding protein [Phycisphaerae bacterium]